MKKVCVNISAIMFALATYAFAPVQITANSAGGWYAIGDGFSDDYEIVVPSGQTATIEIYHTNPIGTFSVAKFHPYVSSSDLGFGMEIPVNYDYTSKSWYGKYTTSFSMSLKLYIIAQGWDHRELMDLGTQMLHSHGVQESYGAMCYYYLRITYNSNSGTSNGNCTVTFNANGGLVNQSTKTCKSGSAVGTLPTPTQSGYTFDGWFTAVSGGTKISAAMKVTKNTTYYAHWTKIPTTYTVVFYDGSVFCEYIFNCGEKTKLPEFDADLGWDSNLWVFMGWSKTQSYTYAPGTVSYKDGAMVKDLGKPGTKVYLWSVKKKPIKITFNPNGGTIPVTRDSEGNFVQNNKRTVVDGSKVGPLPQVENTGYELLGWYTSKGEKISATTIAKPIYEADMSVAYYAHWAPAVSPTVAPISEGCGTVSGGGAAADGKSVTLKAMANKGYVFAGWHDGEGNPLKGAIDYRTTPYSYVSTGEPTEIVAKFASIEADAASLSLINLTNCVAEAGGVFLKCMTDHVNSLSLPKLTVSGLPAGLKYDDKTMTISGTTTKPGKYTVKITATNKSATGKKAVSQEMAIVVPNFQSPYLPNLNPADDAYVAMVGMTLTDFIDLGAAEGWKVTGVAGLPSGITWNKSSNTIGGVPTKSGTYTVTITVAKGKETSKATVTVTIEALPSWLTGAYIGVGNIVDKNSYMVTYDATGTIDSKGKFSCAMNAIYLFNNYDRVVKMRGTMSASNYTAYYDSITYDQAIAWVGQKNSTIANELAGCACFYYKDVVGKIGAVTAKINMIVAECRYNDTGDKIGVVLGVENSEILADYGGEIFLQDVWKRTDILEKPVLASSSISKTIPITKTSNKSLYDSGMRSIDLALKSNGSATVNINYNFSGITTTQKFTGKFYPLDYENGKFECALIESTSDVKICFVVTLTPGADGTISSSGVTVDVSSL